MFDISSKNKDKLERICTCKNCHNTFEFKDAVSVMERNYASVRLSEKGCPYCKSPRIVQGYQYRLDFIE